MKELKHRIVVKVGSNVLTTDEGKLDITRMSALVDQIAFLRHNGFDIILVSSGAVACGRKELKVDHNLDSVEQRQLYSAMGQVKLINLYYDLFREYGMHIGQVLTTKENFSTERTYQNQRACMEVMLENGVIPIVNENDTVSVEELMFTDNDELSGLIAQMMKVDLLVLLGNVNGIYTGNPNDKNSRLIEKVHSHDDISQYIQEGTSQAGRGGMQSKYKTARKIAESGIRVIIANGNRDAILADIVMRPDRTEHTEFTL